MTKAVGFGENNVSNVLKIKILITEESVLKKGNFKLIPHLATLFDLSSIKVEPNTVKVDEKLRFSLHSAKDDLLTNVMVAYRLLSIDGETADQQLTLYLTFNEETKAYEGKLPSIVNQLVSDWVIEYLSAVDSKGDSFLLYNRFIIELDQLKMQEQLAELNNQLLEEQTAEEIYHTVPTNSVKRPQSLSLVMIWRFFCLVWFIVDFSITGYAVRVQGLVTPL